MDSEGRCESSSETSSMHNNPLRKPRLDAPAPAKGILKKSNSNPQVKAKTKFDFMQEIYALNFKFGHSYGVKFNFWPLFCSKYEFQLNISTLLSSTANQN